MFRQGKMLFQRIFSRSYHAMTTMHNVPGFPLANELRLIISQNPFDVNIYGCLNVYLEMIKNKFVATHYLINKFPVLPRDKNLAEQELKALDYASLLKLYSMCPNNTDKEMHLICQFVRHAFYDENWFKDNYFRLACTAGSRYIGGEKDLKSFLLQHYQPGVKYPSKDVNRNINAFVGAGTKIYFLSEASAPTLGEVGILYNRYDDSLLNHPDSLISDVDMVVVAAPPKIEKQEAGDPSEVK